MYVYVLYVCIGRICKNVHICMYWLQQQVYKIHMSAKEINQRVVDSKRKLVTVSLKVILRVRQGKVSKHFDHLCSHQSGHQVTCMQSI